MSVSMSNVVSVQAIVKKDFTKAVKHSSCDCWNLVAATSSKVIAIRNKLDKLTNCLFVCLFVCFFDSLQSFNEIYREIYKLLRCEIHQKFHIIYELAVVLAEKADFKPNIPRVCSEQTHRQSASPDSNGKDGFESYYLRNIAVPFLGNICVELGKHFSKS